jgi:thioredoxin reductase (NADPH)
VEKIYDVVVVGAGPAGLSAALYAARANLSVLLLERMKEGGQIGLASAVENYPGGVRGEEGQALVDRMAEQCGHFGVERLRGEALGYDLLGETKRLNVAGREIASKTVIIATGRRAVQLGAAGETEFLGRGVSYCAACDGPFFNGMDVVVVGGGDSALEEAVYLTKFARKVTLIHRRDSFRAAKYIQGKARANGKIDFLLNSVVREIKGGDLVEEILLENTLTNEISHIRAGEGDGMMGVFIFVGQAPNTDDLPGYLRLEGGYVVTDEEMRALTAHGPLPGVFAAGDVRKKSLRQVVTAAADGAVAAVSADSYINR